MESMSRLFCCPVLNSQKCHKDRLTLEAMGGLIMKVLEKN